MTRREGTSQNNLLCARGNFAPNVDWTQIWVCNRKLGITLVSHRGIKFRPIYRVQFFMENELGQARGLGKFVFDKFWWDQGRHGGTIFLGSAGNLDFLAHFRRGVLQLEG